MANKSKANNFKFPKSPTGLPGLDDITTGGLPQNRSTLLLGNAGCGKTVFAMEFLINGIKMFNEHGVFMSFEEKSEELVLNSRSMNYDLDKLVGENKLYLDTLQVNRHEIVKNGKYDLEGLFVRLQQAIKKVKAKRLVLDSLDALFFGLDSNVLRFEFKRLLTWLKVNKITAIITAEIGDNFLSRHRLEEFIADCVIVLNNRVTNQISTRRLRVTKYRGSIHGNNEYPFIIDEKGITVFPVDSNVAPQKSSLNRISSGIKDLDDMLDKKGFYAGSSILVSGTAGTG